MQGTILNWLVADVPVFGLQAQNWMVLFALFVALYAGVSLLTRERKHS
jgi:hypothetical protein